MGRRRRNKVCVAHKRTDLGCRIGRTNWRQKRKKLEKRKRAGRNQRRNQIRANMWNQICCFSYPCLPPACLSISLLLLSLPCGFTLSLFSLGRERQRQRQAGSCFSIKKSSGCSPQICIYITYKENDINKDVAFFFQIINFCLIYFILRIYI